MENRDDKDEAWRVQNPFILTILFHTSTFPGSMNKPIKNNFKAAALYLVEINPSKAQTRLNLPPFLLCL
jgi:hypothetical protein